MASTGISISGSKSSSTHSGYLCDNGFTRPYIRVLNPDGSVSKETYRNSIGVEVTLPSTLPPSMRFGECVYQKHVISLAGVTLTAPTTVVTHNLNLSVVKAGYIAYDVANGNQTVSFDVGNFAANSFEFQNVPAGMAGMVLDIIVTGEG